MARARTGSFQHWILRGSPSLETLLAPSLAFVPLHNHSDYSLLDGASQLPAMVDRAVALGMPALALTDHGVMYGAIEQIGRAHV